MSTLPTIASVRARPVLAPLARPVRTASGDIPVAPLVLIDIDSKEGVPGRAYLFGYTPHTLKPLCSFLDEIAPLLVGKPAAPSDRLAQLTATFRLLGRQGLVGMVLSGIDMALWDMLGRLAGRPVVELLGGAARPLPAYDSYGIVDPKKDRAALEASVAAGFAAIKIKIGAAIAEADARTVRLVREIVGPDVRLMVDLNQSQTAVDALNRIELLEECGIAWVEEPVPAEDLAGHAQVRAASPVPIQTGENWWFLADMAHAIEAGASDLAMPDLMKIGGITGWMKAAALAEAASLPISSHIFAEASAHVLPVSATAHYLEWLDLAGAVLADPVRPERGTVTARGPGLGMDWDEEAVERYGAG